MSKVVTTSKQAVEAHLKTLPHKDVYVLNDAVTLLLHMLPEHDHARFRRQWRDFQKLQRSNGGSGCTIEAFVARREIEPLFATYPRRDTRLD